MQLPLDRPAACASLVPILLELLEKDVPTEVLSKASAVLDFLRGSGIHDRVHSGSTDGASSLGRNPRDALAMASVGSRKKAARVQNKPRNSRKHKGGKRGEGEQAKINKT